MRMGMELGVDLAVQKDDMFRRTKRLVCMDVDSTFVRGEFIDELAELAGCKEQVSEITARAMRGELDFKQALAERVKLLEGLPLERAMTLLDKIELTPGADRFVQALRSLGFRIGLVSGGFSVFVDELKKRYSLDFAFANDLEIQGGKLTGRVRGTVVDGERKAQILKAWHRSQLPARADRGHWRRRQRRLHAETAGLGIAFRAKAKLQAVASIASTTTSASTPDLPHGLQRPRPARPLSVASARAQKQRRSLSWLLHCSSCAPVWVHLGQRCGCSSLKRRRPTRWPLSRA